jgi:excisionase family DNA binding protein
MNLRAADEQDETRSRIEPLLTVKDVVAITRLSKAKVYQLIDQGFLPCVRPPGCDRLLVAPQDLRQFLDRGRIST